MSLTGWNYKYNGGAATSVAASKLSGFNLTLNGGGDDKLTFTGPGHDIFVAPMFAFGKSFALYYGEDLWFTGRINSTPLSGTPARETISWEVVGPWYYLDKTPFMQSVQHYDTAVGALATTYQSRAQLGQSSVPAAAPLTNGAVISEILTYCLDQNPGIYKIGTISPAVTFAQEDAQDLSCAEALRKMLRWSPDAVLAFDYTTTPPTLNVLTAPPAKSYAVTGSPVTAFQLRPRNDLVPACVAITYELTTEVDGTTYRNNLMDIAPSGATGRELNALTFTVELSGGRSSIIRVECGTQFIYGCSQTATLAQKRAWWKEKIKWLKDLPDADWLIAVDPLADPEVDYPDKATLEGRSPPVLLNCELKIGTVPDWLTKVYVRDAVIRAPISVKVRDAGNNVAAAYREKILEYHCQVTNLLAAITSADPAAEPGTKEARDNGPVYTHYVQDEDPEPVPSGLAQAYYDSLKTLKYEGAIQFARAECLLTDARPGESLILTGGLTEWAAQNHTVQQTTFDIDAGGATIKFGPLPGYQFQDLLELRRLNRLRRIPLQGYDRRDAARLGAKADIPIPPNGAAGKGLQDGAPPKASKFRIQWEDPDDTFAINREIILDPETIALHNVLAVETVDGVLTMRPGWTRAHA